MREDLRNDEPIGPVDDIEAALVKLQPRPSAVNRERLMFLAGKAAGAVERSASKSQGFSEIPGMSRRRRWKWPLATLVSVAAMLVFAVLFGIERGRERPVETVVVRGPEFTVPPKKPVANSHATKVAAKRQATSAGATTDGQASDSLATESRLMRSRHPALMTDPDLLPNAATGGGVSTASPLSVGDTRRAMSVGRSAGRSNVGPPSGFRSLWNSFGRGGL